jgi:glycosyltransferase involved in cell wall biosynthesis
MGKANGLNYIINAAKILTEYNNKEIAFYFAGYGTTEELLKTEVEKNNLKNVFFLGKHNTFMISELVNCMDVSLVCFLNNEILKTNSPNKLFDSLSAGKLIIVNSSGWTKDLVENYNCGYFVNPENAEDLANKLIHIFNNKNEQKIMSNNSRKISIEIFDKEILTIRFKEVIDNYFNL